MNPPRRLEKIFDTLGMLGLMMRSKRISSFDAIRANRAWGPAVEQFDLSVLAVPSSAKTDEQVKLSVALRNGTGREIRHSVPAWLSYFELEIVRPSGAPAVKTAYGQALLGSSSTNPAVNAVISPSTPLHVELPLSDIYDLSEAGAYRITASCAVPLSGARCRSNETLFVRTG
jgi:hypothetical protein